MNEWKMERTVHSFVSALQSGAIAASRDNCTASSPFEIYTQLPPRERDMLLKCLGCGKSFSYISGLVSHFKVCWGHEKLTKKGDVYPIIIYHAVD